MSRTMSARKLRSIHSKNFYKELDNFSTACMNKMKRRKIYLFSGKYFEVERLIVETKSKEEVSLAAYHSSCGNLSENKSQNRGRYLFWRDFFDFVLKNISLTEESKCNTLDTSSIFSGNRVAMNLLCVKLETA